MNIPKTILPYLVPYPALPYTQKRSAISENPYLHIYPNHALHFPHALIHDTLLLNIAAFPFPLLFQYSSSLSPSSPSNQTHSWRWWIADQEGLVPALSARNCFAPVGGMTWHCGRRIEPYIGVFLWPGYCWNGSA